jgi:peptide/nickel transport system ATP-binding protein
MMQASESELDARLSRKPPVQMVVEDLRVAYRTERGPFRAVDGISFEVAPGSVLGLVGESGCGKSTVVKALLRLLPDSAATSGRVLLDGADVLAMDARTLRSVRWNKLALVTQSAMNALDPVVRIGDQIVESIRAHEDVDKAAAMRRAAGLFALVGLPPERLIEFPHQFSGGMRQRAVIAMALSLNAGLLLADEPTTALDPIMQDQIMSRIRDIQRSLARSMILVTHDVGVVAENCDTVAVMYAGKIVEKGPTLDVLTAPRHPYTMGLRNAFPRMPEEGETRPPLISISGGLPDLLQPPPGCRFAPRCPFATALCIAEEPPLAPAGSGHQSACHYHDRAAEFRAAALNPATWRKQDMAP